MVLNNSLRKSYKIAQENYKIGYCEGQQMSLRKKQLEEVGKPQL